MSRETTPKQSPIAHRRRHSRVKHRRFDSTQWDIDLSALEQALLNMDPNSSEFEPTSNIFLGARWKFVQELTTKGDENHDNLISRQEWITFFQNERLKDKRSDKRISPQVAGKIFDVVVDKKHRGHVPNSQIDTLGKMTQRTWRELSSKGLAKMLGKFTWFQSAVVDRATIARSPYSPETDEAEEDAPVFFPPVKAEQKSPESSSDDLFETIRTEMEEKYRSEIRGLENDAQVKETEMTELRAEMEALQVSADQLKDSVIASRAELFDERQRFKNLEAEAQRALQAKEEELFALHAQKESELNALKQQIFSDLGSIAETASIDVSRLQSRLDETTANLRSSNRKIAELENTIAVDREEYEMHLARVNEQHKDEMAVVQQELDNAINDARQLREALKQSATTAVCQTNQYRIKIAELEIRLADKQLCNVQDHTLQIHSSRNQVIALQKELQTRKMSELEQESLIEDLRFRLASYTHCGETKGPLPIEGEVEHEHEVIVPEKHQCRRMMWLLLGITCGAFLSGAYFRRGNRFKRLTNARYNM